MWDRGETTPTLFEQPVSTADYAFKVDDDAAHRLVGRLIVSLIPALFWTALFAGVGAVAGYWPSAVILATVGFAIATFLDGVTRSLFGH